MAWFGGLIVRDGAGVVILLGIVLLIVLLVSRFDLLIILRLIGRVVLLRIVLLIVVRGFEVTLGWLSARPGVVQRIADLLLDWIVAMDNDWLWCWWVHLLARSRGSNRVSNLIELADHWRHALYNDISRVVLHGIEVTVAIAYKVVRRIFVLLASEGDRRSLTHDNGAVSAVIGIS